MKGRIEVIEMNEVQRDHITELEADQRRLEWLVKESSTISGNYVCIHRYIKYVPNWRDAIDEAMKQEGE
jgi:hypothetical protein